MKKIMKKIGIGMSIAVMAAVCLAGCGSSSIKDSKAGEVMKGLPEGFEEETIKEQAMEDIKLAQSNDYESWKSRFSPEFQENLTEDNYQSYIEHIEKQGEFKGFGKCSYLGQIKDEKKYAGVIIAVKYEEGNVKYSVAYDENMNLISFTM